MSHTYVCERYEGPLGPLAGLLHPGKPAPAVVRELERTYLHHPHGRGELWVCRHDGELAALLAAARRRFRIGGTEVRGGILTDLVVAPDHRRQGLMQILLGRAFEDLGALGYAILYGFPNDAALPGHRKAGGWTELGTLESTSVRPAPLLGALRLAARRAPAPVRRVAGPVIDLASRSLTPRPRGRAGLSFEQTTPTDAELDRLFEAAKGPATGVRDAGFHRWRFGGGPKSPAKVVYARRRGSLEGYLALRLSRTALGESVVTVLDVLGVGAAPHALLAAAPALARREAAVELSYPRLGDERPIPWPLARSRPTSAVVIVRSPDGTFSPGDLRETPFRFTLADSDVA